MNKEILTRLNQILALLAQLIAGASKPLTLSAAATYLGISKSHLYHKTASGEITHYKPEGKLIYFKQEDLDAYLFRNRREAAEAVEEKASTYIVTHPAPSGRRPPRTKQQEEPCRD